MDLSNVLVSNILEQQFQVKLTISTWCPLSQQVPVVIETVSHLISVYQVKGSLSPEWTVIYLQ